jgi:hypothetical protein
MQIPARAEPVPDPAAKLDQAGKTRLRFVAVV